MYNKVSTNLDFVQREKEVLRFWKENEIFKKSQEIRKGSPVFTFFEGPPTANGQAPYRPRDHQGCKRRCIALSGNERLRRTA